MKNLLSILLLSTVACSTALAQEVYFETDFARGIPSDITVKDYDENPTMSGLMNVDFNGGSWSTALVDKGNAAAVSSSYTSYDYSVDDWMILPSIHIKSPAAVLAWDGTSLHYDFREDYRVLISEGGTNPADFVEVYSVTDEDYFTCSHAIPLEAYEGKDIRIAFVHEGQDGFILAIDNIKVGVWDGKYALINHTDVSAKGGEEVEITGYIRNLSSTDWFNPTLVVDGVETPYYGQDGEVIPPAMWKTGEDVYFSFTVTAPTTGIFRYSLKANDWTANDSIFCSNFALNVLTEKFTGTWCNGCPAGTVNLHRFEQRYRNRIIPVEGHCADIMQDYYYAMGLNKFNSNLPSFVYNRLVGNKSQSGEDDGNIAVVMAKPAYAEVVPTVRYTEDGKLEINSVVRFAKDYDNSSDRYRVGYAIIENVVHVEDDAYIQTNNCQMAQYREYYYLSSNIPSKLMYYHNVARGDSTAFEGLAHSLPNETLTSGVDYETTYTMDIPASVLDKRNISVIAIVLYNRTYEVLNSCRVTTDEIDWSADVTTAISNEQQYRYITDDERVIVAGIDGKATVKAYAMDGSLIGSTTGNGTVSVSTHGYSGVAVIAVETATDVEYRKVIIK